MKQLTPFFLGMAAMSAIVFAGCGSPSTKPATSKAPATSDESAERAQGGHGDHAHHENDGQSDMEKTKAELAH